MGYIQLNYRPDDKDVVCDFYLEPGRGLTVKKAAEHVAAESSIGTWTDVSTMSPRIMRMSAKVFSIKGNNIKIAYPEELFERGNVPQIMSSVGGNVFGMKPVKNLRLNDIMFTKGLVRSFPGPHHGIGGIRKMLKVRRRPLLGTIVKPKLGLMEKQHARVAYDAWVGGLDIVKDDENLSSMRFNDFDKRVRETLKLRDRAEHETGEKKIYMPNITAETNEMIRRARLVKESGGEYIMVDILTLGWAALQTVRESNKDLKMVIHGHRAGHAALDRNPRHGISMMVIARLSRMIGMDQLHVGTASIGKMVQEDPVRGLEDALTCDWHGLKKTFPVASGGLHPGMIPELVKKMGSDIIAQFGGGCHGHPGGTRKGAAAIRQAADATVRGIDLKDYAKTNYELGEALRMWGR
ncbi:MAG: type III ribulose-bisphosphate carboxylase [Candidatus Aenigmatarchaeota archaeon]|nr:MAG: type III ribulose-bisphosphate carboxylase [Candidatus Aenigmarchaeota archaeon]